MEKTPCSRVLFEEAVDRIDREDNTDLTRALYFHIILLSNINSGTKVTKSGYRRRFDPKKNTIDRWRRERVEKISERLWSTQIECRDALLLLNDIKNKIML